MEKDSNTQATFLNRIFKKILRNPISVDLEKRIISAAILIPVAIYAISFSVNLFFFIAIILVIIMTAEWLEITKNAKSAKQWNLIGIAYISIPIFCVINLRMINSDILLWMFGVIWATDIFAYFSGKMFGGAKMAPTISPNKTWSGLAGGVIASMIIGLLSSFIFPGSALFFIVISAFLAIIEQAGDLTESKIKRLFKVKDSGNVIPGHGGILDRIDGLLYTAPVLLFLVTVFPNNFIS